MVKIVVYLVRCYQVFLSPVFGGCCRFHPSCSEYCLAAVQRFGFFRGLWLSIRRIGKCHPFHPGGIDPVPHEFSSRLVCQGTGLGAGKSDEPALLITGVRNIGAR